jgi:CubicO group peptidase (beta-lactamase class C family)
MKNTLRFAVISLFLTACVPLRSVRYLVPDVNDSSKFNNVAIPASRKPFRFNFSIQDSTYSSLQKRLDTSLIGAKTNAFLVIKNDTVIYQYFGKNIEFNSKHASFSMAKVYVGTLVGIAVDRALITSTNDLVIKYLPELAKNDERYKRLTIQHVLDMKAGFDFKEISFSPFSKITRSYYGADLKKIVGKLKFENEPGKVFEYQSIPTQVLAMILEKVTNKKIDVLLAENLWEPLGNESDALWSVDKNGNVKSFCCISANALDYAKLGRLYLKNGNWQGQQIISKKWVETTTHPDTLTQLRYKNQMWAARDFKYFKDSVSAVVALRKDMQNYKIEKAPDGRYFYARRVYDYKIQGMFQQSVYVNPLNNVIIVRLGERQKKVNFHRFMQTLGRGIK